MIRGALQNRSGRVIALGRASLAAFYLFAAAIAPFPGREATAEIQAVLTVYVFTAVGLLVFTWDNWWLEERLGAVAHLGDILVLGLLVTLSTDGYASPVFIFFIFLVLSAAMRWGWREALVTAGVVGILFAIATWLALESPSGEPFQPQRFVMRSANLVVMSLMLAWFGVNRIGGPLGGKAADTLFYADNGDRPVERAMRYLADRLRAPRVIFLWSEAEEPWLNLSVLEGGEFYQETAGPERFPRIVAPELKRGLFLFDSLHGRVLCREGGRRVALSMKDAINSDLVERFGIHSGIAIPVRTESFEGELFALDVPGLCADDLAIASRIENEIRSAFERASLIVAMEDAAMSRARLSLARDLHDNVAQILAGMSLKLRGIRKHASNAAFVEEQLAVMEHELVQQQQDIRMLIHMLRKPPEESDRIDFRKDLAALALRLERQWGVEIRLRSLPDCTSLSAALRHDVRQLVREAVANAVRHGQAQLITIAATRDDNGLHLELTDDGSGLGFEGELDDGEMWEKEVGPRSLHERVGSLGGTLKLISGSHGTRLIITIPNEGV